MDKNSLESIIKEKERMVLTLNRQLGDAKDDLKNKEREFRVTYEKLSDDEKHRSKEDKFKLDSQKDEIQELEQKLYKLELRTRKESERLEEDNEKLIKEARIVHDENKTLKGRINEMAMEIDIIRKTNIECKIV